MKLARRKFLHLAAGAVAGFVALTPARSQTESPTIAPPASTTQSSVSIPDFSGMWSHPYLPGFEPPSAGPGPVVNKSRRRQIVDTDNRPLPAANAPLVSNTAQFVGDYTNPILKHWAAEVVKKHAEIELGGVTAPTPSNQCWPEPVLYIFSNAGIQMLQQPEGIIIVYLQDHQVRHVRMNQSHPAQVTPSWYGDSVGHYEGDTLVIDTVGVKIAPFSMIDWYGTPFTEALHLVERYRLLEYEATMEAVARDAKEHFQQPYPDNGPRPDPNYKGKGLQVQVTVEDEGAFTMPWSATVTFRRALDEWGELVCTENIRWSPGRDSTVPQADRPDF